MNEITLTIDGQKIKAQKGDTVLEATQKAGIRIPTLCAHEELEPYGACRLCIVQIEGLRGNPTSCTTPATDGMVVSTKTDEIIDTRREIIKLMLSGHTSPCLVCSDRELCEKYRPRPFKSGKATRCTFCSNRDSCELRDLAVEYKIEEFELPIIYKKLDLERNDPFMDRDYNLCVLCGRCARICEKLHEKGAIDFINRGEDARISTAFQRPHTETNCKFCGACIDICPTGALTDRFAKWHGTPDTTQESTCMLCPHGCSLLLMIKNEKVMSTGMTEFTKKARICAVGRFVLPQLLDNPMRLVSHRVRVEDGMIKTTYDDAVAKAAEKLDGFSGSQFALITHAASTREEIYLLKKFAKEAMKSDNFAIARADGDGVVVEPALVVKAIEKGTVKALYSIGNYIDSGVLEALETHVVSDMFTSSTEKTADVVISAASLVETSGTFKNAAGEIKTLPAVVTPLDGLLPDWQIACDIAKKMGISGFDFRSVDEISKELSEKGIDDKAPVVPEPSPLDDVDALPRFYRGHKLSDVVCALEGIIRPYTVDEAAVEQTAHGAAAEEKRFEIIEKIEIVPNTHMVTVYAPVVAEKCLPGQFVIAMVTERSERIPYTISDYDREKGTITLVIIEVGRSSRELANTRVGDFLTHLVGPLGRPVEIKKFGTVVCAGGCYGVGAMLPIARAMKEAGNKVICIEEASSHYLLHWQDRLSENCDELIIVTKDGSAGMKGGVQDVISTLVDREEKIDQAYIIGCTFMLMLVSEVAKKHSIPTQTAMNSIMLDGTGMCGACRVSVGDTTKFACVDGPFLDGLKIDWIELMQRQTAFKKEEIEGLPQNPSQMHFNGNACSYSNG
ncbi:MAG: sulfide/dihydroorotate dehydrogenase-like FAD/NAD-binding protein [Deltaproteobacteria bacterium]|nr:sulfide/dihydroorotate dehydrogenase-like FAD/NAD-binding protein [Deltaproteobacteria bacterium]MBL7174429.1 sulfide/dihydroorotate dehydrogenase-like FAD/NAD-binding protein [Desulfobacteraceae bacterium]